MEESFHIQGLSGARTLSGEIAVSGAKNAVLPALAATVLTAGTTALKNVPGVEDVSRMCELLSELGCTATHAGDAVTVDASGVHNSVLVPDIATRLRASIFLTGPLLVRTGKVSFPHPGGDVIGTRPIDLFLEGFEQMGARVRHDASTEMYHLSAPKGLRGARIVFPFVSVGATETLMMAAVCAEGVTELRNAAMEPEVVFLAEMLNARGARIQGAGTPYITIEGVPELTASDAPVDIIPDRIEAGTYLILAALAGRDVSITGCVPAHLELLISRLRKAGLHIDIDQDCMRVQVRAKETLKSVDVRTHEYPGFATDLQAPMSVLLTQCTGEAVVFETIFEGRLHYTEDLVHMGADITPIGTHRVVIRGPQKLRGRELAGPDIRAGLAYVLAAIVAEGESVVRNAYHIDRGYERVEEKLQKLGVHIRRI